MSAAPRLRSVERPSGAAGAAGAVVMVHGRGADEHDLVGLADRLDPERHAHWYLPRGPLSLPPGGAHWYVVDRVGYPDAASFAQGFAALAGFVDGLPYERVVLGGFSQGAVMSLAVGLGRGRPRPAAVLALSGFVPVVEGFALGERPFPPIAIGHGTLDPVIPVAFARQARATLEAAGASDILYHESALGHAIDPAFLDELVPWLGRALA